MKVKTITYELTLEEMKEGQGLTNVEIAELLGVSKDTVRQMLLMGREIYLRRIEGVWHFSEFKDWKHEPDKGVNRLTGKRSNQRPKQLTERSNAA